MAATTEVRQDHRALDVDGGLLLPGSCLSGARHWMPGRGSAGSGWCGWRREPAGSARRRDPSHKTLVPASAASSSNGKRDTPAGLPGSRGRGRYGWSWPEPPAGVTPHQRREPRALAKTGACGQPGSRTANRMAGHRALPLGSGRTSRGLDQHGQQVNSRNSECMRRKG